MRAVSSVVPDSATQWAVARQAPLSMGFSRQEYWSGLPCPPPGDLPNPGIKPKFLYTYLHWPTGSLPLAWPGKSIQQLDCKKDTQATQTCLQQPFWFFSTVLEACLTHSAWFFHIPPSCPMSSPSRESSLMFFDTNKTQLLHFNPSVF